MDPLGFALDNYDIVGRWRMKEGGAPIDASAIVAHRRNTSPDRPVCERCWRRSRIASNRHLAAKLLGYALGRSLEDGDDCTIDRIVAETNPRKRRHDAGVDSAAVVRSVPFRMVARQAEPTTPAEQASAGGS